MDEKVETSVSEMETGVDDVPPAQEQDAADTAAATAPRALDLNELQEFSEKKLKALARDFDLHLHPARSRHQHILDIVRAAMTGGATFSAEGFLDQVSDSFAMLRWPKLNFLPVPEDVAVPRTFIEQYDLRPGQKVAGTVRLPVQREKFLSLDKVTKVENQPAEEWKQSTAFDKLTPQFPQGRIILENPNASSVCARAVDLMTPLGRGQRGLIVCAAARWQDHFAEGNCESDSGKLSRDCSYPAAGGRAAGRSNGFAAGDRLRDLSFKLRRKRAAPCASGGDGAGARETPGGNET
jgi:transcription termination factor Rho